MLAEYDVLRGCISGNANVEYQQLSWYEPATYQCRARVFKDQAGYGAEALRFPGSVVRAESLDTALQGIAELYQTQLEAYLNAVHVSCPTEPQAPQLVDVAAMQYVSSDDQRWILVQLKNSVPSQIPEVVVDQDLANELAAWDAASAEVWNRIE